MANPDLIDRQCKAQATSTGKRCRRLAVDGDVFCIRHRTPPGVTVPSERSKTPAKVAAVTAEVVEVLRAGGVEVAAADGTPDPTEVLRWCVVTTQGMAERINGLLEGAQIESAEMWPLLRHFREYLEATARAAKADLDAGVQKRRLALMEGQVQVAFLAIERAIEAFPMEPVQRAELRRLIGRELEKAAGG